MPDPLFFTLDISLVLLPYAFICASRKLNPLRIDSVKAFLADLCLKPEISKKAVFQALFLVLALLLFSSALSFGLELAGLNDLEKVDDAISGISSRPFFLAYVLLVAVPAEEIFFRGFLVKRTGAVMSSVLFGLAHIGFGSLAEVLGAFVLGLVLAKAFERNQNLFPNIFAHMLYNAGVVLLAVVS